MYVNLLVRWSVALGLCAQSLILAQGLSFAARRVYGQAGAQDIAIADFNGDGRPDIAIASVNGAVAVLLGNGDGTFRNGPSTTIGPGLHRMVAGDFNGDGKPDLAFTTQGNNIFVALGNGDGSFDLHASIVLGLNGDLIAADFNGDRKLDLAVATQGGIAVLLGGGDGTFGAPLITTLALPAQNFAAGDLSGDGRQSLVVTNSTGIVILPGKGDGTFGAPRSMAFTNGALAVAIADLNGDGRADLALIVDEYATKVAILLGKGGGAFQAPVYYDSKRCGSIAIGDVNGDGIPDIETDSVEVFQGTGGGVLEAPKTYTAGYYGGHSLLADLRGGKPDIVTADPYGEEVSILLNRGDGTYFDGLKQPAPAGLGSMVTGDFNGDGLLDVAGVVSPNSVAVFLGTGDARMPFILKQSVSVPFGAESATAADFNGDGKLDLAVAISNVLGPGSVAILLGNGDGTFGNPTVFPASSLYAGALAVADFNGDGKPDLVTSGTTVLLGNGDGSFQAPIVVADINSVALAVGDFNGDGKADFVGIADDNLNLFLGNGDGTFQPPIPLPTGQVPEQVVAADFNGDGRPDLALTTYLNVTGVPMVSVLLNNGNGTFQLSEFGPGFWAYPGNVIAADLNGDGAMDLVITDPPGLLLSMYMGNGDGTFTFAGSFGTGHGPASVVAGPFHKGSQPGKADLLVSTGQATASVLLNTKP